MGSFKNKLCYNAVLHLVEKEEILDLKIKRMVNNQHSTCLTI